MTSYVLQATDETVGHINIYQLCRQPDYLIVKGDYHYCQLMLSYLMAPGDRYCEISRSGKITKTITYRERTLDLQLQDTRAAAF